MSKRCVPIKDSICDDQLRTCIECNSVDISHIFALRWFNARDKNMSGNGAQWMLKKKKICKLCSVCKECGKNVGKKRNCQSYWQKDCVKCSPKDFTLKICYQDEEIFKDTALNTFKLSG